jgi:DNA-3-methyladenine glycosylase I
VTADGLRPGADGALRCFWCGDDPLYQRYHDTEWGFPVADDRRLFEKICLEGFQSGLSWLTILRKREAFRDAFDGFDPARVSRYDARRVEKLLKNAGIVRHRGKIESTINNARRALDMSREHGSLAAFFWSHEPRPEARPRTVDRATLAALARTPESTALSRALKKEGWSFVGPTTLYAFMQAMGLVNDHLEGCFVRPRALEARRRFPRPA